MRNFFSILFFSLTFLSFSGADAQIFRNRDRPDNLEAFDEQRFSWGFYLAGNHVDYKLVLDPKYGTYNGRNSVDTKTSYSFGAGLIGKMRLNEFFDLRFEPGLQFVDREIIFNTQNNDQFSGGTPQFPAFTPQTLTDADKTRNVKSTYIDLPLLLEVHGERWYNSRPYAAGGVNWLLNLQSNSKSAEDNAQGTFRSTTSNFAWTAELGIQLYFRRFKLTPAIRGTFMTNNELVKDNPETPPYWTAAIATMQTRALMLVLKFE